MHQQINFNGFLSAFRAMDRDNQFSYAGKRALFDYIEDYEEEIGDSIELDVVALCCDYSESTWEEIAEDYSIDLEDGEEVEDTVREYLEENTVIVGEVPGGFVFANF